jgi:hypothetical protein
MKGIEKTKRGPPHKKRIAAQRLIERAKAELEPCMEELPREGLALPLAQTQTRMVRTMLELCGALCRKVLGEECKSIMAALEAQNPMEYVQEIYEVCLLLR